MSNMCIKVEFLAGTSIEAAIQEAKDKCIQWEVAYVLFDFNGVSASVSRKADVESGVDMYLDAMSSNSKHFVV